VALPECLTGFEEFLYMFVGLADVWCFAYGCFGGVGSGE
jgi:hypothetical protein